MIGSPSDCTVERRSKKKLLMELFQHFSHCKILHFGELLLLYRFELNSLLKSTENPFILSNVHGQPCQKVCGAKETKLAFETATPIIPLDDMPTSTITGVIKPAGKASNEILELSYCYYEKMANGWYNNDSDKL